MVVVVVVGTDGGGVVGVGGGGGWCGTVAVVLARVPPDPSLTVSAGSFKFRCGFLNTS